MEDKRIVKTKRSLKAAMTEMLGKEDFEHISITELCRKAEISRITFYSHYSDKYALLDDIFNDEAEYIFNCHNIASYIYSNVYCP